jgi:predicted site-specific integrase-resolvase
MTLPLVPTYIPIKDAAVKYGYGLAELKRLAESGKIKAVKLPDGDMIVSENELEFPEIKTEEELKAYKDKHYADLEGKETWVSQAARKYEVPHQNIVRWIKAGYIRKFGMDQNKVLISEQDVAFYVGMHKKFGGKGRRLFNVTGFPQRPKTGPLAA